MARAGLEALLRSDPELQVIVEPADELNSSEVFPMDSQIDVVLIQADSVDNFAAALDSSTAGAAVILLVSDPTTSAEAFRHGVRAVLPSNLPASQITAAIEAVAAGLGVFDPGAIEQPSSLHAMSEPPEPLREALTARETEVLRAMAEGLANKEIAARFGISENTVKFHVGSVMGKLGAASRTEAVTLGIRHGIVFI
jgi:DNA-binding NarL/FixJ family response regulator